MSNTNHAIAERLRKGERVRLSSQAERIARGKTITVLEKYCPSCETKKQASEFAINNARCDGLTTYCRECQYKYRDGRAGSKKVTHKTCTTCKTTKAVDEFASSNYNVDGHTYVCRDCERERRLLKNYGISHSEYEAQFLFQNGFCAICQQPSIRPLVVDHNHSTGFLRELLCNDCNHAIGQLKEDTVRLARAIAYIQKHSDVENQPTLFKGKKHHE